MELKHVVAEGRCELFIQLSLWYVANDNILIINWNNPSLKQKRSKYSFLLKDNEYYAKA